MPGVCFNSWQASGCGWSIPYYWNMMDRLSRIDISVLLLMLANVGVIAVYRVYRYHLARRQSCAFVRDASVALYSGSFDEVIVIAARNSGSHIAAVVAAGLTAFASAPPQFTDTDAIDAAQRALRRRHKVLAADLRLGLGTLGTIISSAPFIGLLGTCAGIMNAFRGYGMEKSTAIAMTASYLAEALVTAAMGVVVAVFAVWSRNYLLRSMELFESEMSNAALETVTYLNAHREWRNQPEYATTSKGSLFAADASAVPSWEIPYDRQRALLLALWCSALYVVFVFGRGAYSSYVGQHTGNEVSSRFGSVGGQQSISPDHRYRAVIPVVYRWKESWSNPDGGIWSCSSPAVAVRIIPNNRSLEWRPYRCEDATRYALEQTPALLSWNCTVPVVAAWRTNDELSVQCTECSADTVQVINAARFPRITVRGADGKVLHPQVVHPQPECPE